jgi:hypothetical protein
MNKISELRSRISSGEQVVLSVDDFNQLQSEWITRASPEITINELKAFAISEMIDSMPSSGFNSERERNNWIGDYIYELNSNPDLVNTRDNVRNKAIDDDIEALKECELVEPGVKRIRLYEAMGAVNSLKN